MPSRLPGSLFKQVVARDDFYALLTAFSSAGFKGLVFLQFVVCRAGSALDDSLVVERDPATTLCGTDAALLPFLCTWCGPVGSRGFLAAVLVDLVAAADLPRLLNRRSVWSMLAQSSVPAAHQFTTTRPTTL